MVAMNSFGSWSRKRCLFAGFRAQYLLPALEFDHGLHAAVPGGADRRFAVVGAQRYQAEHPSADPPHGQPAGHLGVAGGRQHRHPGAARSSDDDRGGHAEMGEQAGESVGLHG